jgi:hypothetical protein
MTVQNAIDFITRGLGDNQLRARINAAETPEARDEILEGEKLLFSNAEFDEGYHHKLTRCQTPDQADQLKEFKLWWDFLAQTMGPDSCTGACAGCSR